MPWGERLRLYSHIKKEMKLEGTIKNTEWKKKAHGDWWVSGSRNKGVRAEKL